MIVHKEFDFINDILNSTTRNNNLKFSLYCLKDSFEFLKYRLKREERLFIAINSTIKTVEEYLKTGKLSGKFDQTHFNEEHKYILNINNEIQKFFSFNTIHYEISYKIYNYAIHIQLNKDEKEKEYFGYANSFFTTNTLKDNFFSNLNFNEFEDLCIFFDFLEDNYPKHNLLLKALSNSYVKLNLPPGLNIFAENNLRLTEKIFNTYKWIPDYLNSLYSK